MASFTARDLIFVFDVIKDDHDVANFEIHDGGNVLRKNVITCGKTNPVGRVPTFEDKEFAVQLKSERHLRALREALLVMLNKLNSVEQEAIALSAEKKAARDQAQKKKLGKGKKSGKAKVSVK